MPQNVWHQIDSLIIKYWPGVTQWFDAERQLPQLGNVDQGIQKGISYKDLWHRTLPSEVSAEISVSTPQSPQIFGAQIISL